MNKLNSMETHSNLDAIPLSDQTKFRQNEINKIKDLNCFICNIWRNNYYFFYKFIGIPAGIASTSFTLVFS